MRRLYEFTCKVYVKRDLSFFESFEVISRFVSFALADKKEFLARHNKNEFKTYSFGSFVECATKKVPEKIEAGGIFCFTFRTIDEQLARDIPRLLKENTNNPFFTVVEVGKKKIEPFFISELYTLSPCVTTTPEGKFWSFQNSGDIMLLQQLLHNNLVRKYKQFYGEITPIQNFIQLLEIKNKTPQFLSIKKQNQTIKLLGNKFRIIPNEDEVSQKLAFLSLGAGLGEKNTLGGGFCISKGMR